MAARASSTSPSYVDRESAFAQISCHEIRKLGLIFDEKNTHGLSSVPTLNLSKYCAAASLAGRDNSAHHAYGR